jgi:para-nitrobenzyl esterase
VGAGVDILKEGTHRAIPYMAGSTSHDMMPPIIFDMAKKWCTAQAAQGKHSSYAWFFDRKLPGDKNGAWHSSDLWYWFGTLPNGWRPFEQKDYELSDQMVSYLCNFARNGNPNKTGQLPTWIASGKGQSKVMGLGEGKTGMKKPNLLKMVKTMLTNKAVGE